MRRNRDFHDGFLRTGAGMTVDGDDRTDHAVKPLSAIEIRQRLSPEDERDFHGLVPEGVCHECAVVIGEKGDLRGTFQIDAIPGDAVFRIRLRAAAG